MWIFTLVWIIEDWHPKIMDIHVDICGYLEIHAWIGYGFSDQGLLWLYLKFSRCCPERWEQPPSTILFVAHNRSMFHDTSIMELSILGPPPMQCKLNCLIVLCEWTNLHPGGSPPRWCAGRGGMATQEVPAGFNRMSALSWSPQFYDRIIPHQVHPSDVHLQLRAL